MEIELHFICPCGAIVEEAVEGGAPPWAAETFHYSFNESWGTVVCDGCGKDFEAHVRSSISSTVVTVAGAIDLSWELSQLAEDQELIWEIELTAQLELYKKVASDVIALLRSDYPEEAAYTLYCMLYAQIVTAVEAYLSGVFIHKVLNSENLIKALIESDRELAKRQFSLSEIFTKWQNLKVEVARYLKDLIFHDLKKIRPMYRDVLGYEFEDIGWLFRAVLIRHDCVHRNGLTKDGARNNIDADVIRQLVLDCTGLVSSIDRFVDEVHPTHAQVQVATDRKASND